MSIPFSQQLALLMQGGQTAPHRSTTELITRIQHIIPNIVTAETAPKPQYALPKINIPTSNKSPSIKKYNFAAHVTPKDVPPQVFQLPAFNPYTNPQYITYDATTDYYQITGLPTTITTSGKYRLSPNLTNMVLTIPAIIVNANNVDIDLFGNTVIINRSTPFVFAQNVDELSVHNGLVRTGIPAVDNYSNAVNLSNVFGVRIDKLDTENLFINFSLAGCENVTITNCHTDNNGEGTMSILMNATVNVLIENCMMDMQAPSDDFTAIGIEYNNESITIKGCKINDLSGETYGESIGIEIGPETGNVQIVDCQIYGCALGIGSSEGGDNLLIQNVQITSYNQGFDSGSLGIFLLPAPANATIRDCSISATYGGIICIYGLNTTIENCKIFTDDESGQIGIGIAICLNVHITNVVTTNFYCGIANMGSQMTVIDSCNITYAQQSNIYSIGGYDTTIQNCKISGKTDSGSCHGIYLQCEERSLLNNNSVTGCCGNGIALCGHVCKSTVSNNSSFGNGYNGLFIGNCATNNVINNNMFFNNQTGIDNINGDNTNLFYDNKAGNNGTNYSNVPWTVNQGQSSQAGQNINLYPFIT
jgi:hypothetical protein